MVGIDDAMDIFAEHGVGGMVGLLFTALCADSTITGLDGVTTNTKGGIIDHNWQQLRIQAVYVAAAALYTFSVSTVLLKIINSIPALRLRCTEEEESMGMDAVDVSCFTEMLDNTERPCL
jgi:ammonium transporter, Amt family